MRTQTPFPTLATAVLLAGALAVPATASAHGPGRGWSYGSGPRVVYVKPQHHHRHRVMHERYIAPIRRSYRTPVRVYRELPRWRYGGADEIGIIYRGPWD